jgi:hypothetical protein
MVDTVRLTSARTYFNIVRETSLVHALAIYTIKMIHDRRPYPHGCVQCSGNLVILFKSRAAAQDFGKPELAHSPLHVSYLSLSRSRSLYPL